MIAAGSGFEQGAAPATCAQADAEEALAARQYRADRAALERPNMGLLRP